MNPQSYKEVKLYNIKLVHTYIATRSRKDLTMTSNNLNSNYACYKCKCKSRHIRFSVGNYRKKFIGHQFTTKRKFQQKKAEEVKNQTYKLLLQNIFLPLEENIIDYELIGNQFIPRFKFDPLNVQSNRYFPEALKHLKKDIENFDDFKWIKDSINTYNEDVENFEKNKSNELLKEYLEPKNFFIKAEAIVPNKENEIVIPSLSKILKNYWFKKESFHYKWQDEYIIINQEPIAKITNEKRAEFDECINELKNYDKINEEVENIYCYHNIIAKKIIELSEHITKIIIKIEKSNYNTTCSECS